MSISSKIKNSELARVYSPRTELGKGRLCMLLNSITSGLAGNLSGGLFYSGFLLEYGFDYSSISILALVPYFTILLTLVSPSLLERFKKRKYILAATKLVVNIINILGITVLPTFFAKDDGGNIINMAGMKAAFIAITLAANVINTLFSQGYTAWHANFLPDEVRADYVLSSSCINSLITYATVFVLSIITDNTRATDPAHYLTLLTAMRYAAFVFAVIDIIVLMIPREFEYPKTVEKPRISDVFSLPFKNKPFLMTVIILIAITFAQNIHAGYVDAYVLDTIEIPYSLTNGINALYFAFFIIFGNVCKKFIAKNTWFKALGLILLFEGLSYILYSFIFPHAYALYTSVRLWQHIGGVVRGTITGALIYVNLPESDRVNYLSFYSIMNSLSALAARLCG
ncbi:MAG: hypothetical protein KBS59_01215, partial [Clostridiales bacterium]|nr:hypothetical protein [Clostridiales bacterium]